MVSLYFAIPFLVLVGLLEATVLPLMRVGNAQPDMTLLVVGAWSLRRGVNEGALWAFIGGIGLDLLSAGPPSAFMFALLLASLVLGFDPSTGAGRHQARSFADNPLALIAAVAFGTLAYHMVLLASLGLTGYTLDWLNAGTRVVAPHLLFNLVLMPFVFRLLGWLDSRTAREEFVL